MSRLLIADAKLVNGGRLQDADLRIRDGCIDAIVAGPWPAKPYSARGTRPDAGYDRRSDALSRAPHAGLSA